MMNKVILLIIVFAFSITGNTQSKYDFKEKGKSVVQIMVKIPGKDPNVCTGFVWKQKDWVVTSLHAMHPKGTIEILYGGVWNKNVSVIRVHEKADLVLLQINQPAMFPADVVPIKEIETNTNPIPYDEKLSSIGYNMGARAAQPKNLIRGGTTARTENLYNNLPPDVVEKLEAFKVPDVKIEIMMLEGSLLPGYSGSPIFHKEDGSLVAIGDGGLDAGTKNVSWGIPAKYLAELEKSDVKTVPFGIESSPLHYSSSVKIKDEAVSEKINSEPEEWDTEELYELMSEEYAGIQYGDYEFYYVKTRSYAELYETSFDTENLDSLKIEFESLGLYLDFSLFEFDIYEDPYNEVILVVPAGMPLFIDQTGTLSADLSLLPMGQYFGLYYGVDNTFSDISTASVGIMNLLNTTDFGVPLGGWTEHEDEYYGYQLDDYSAIAWMLAQANNTYETQAYDEYGNVFTENNVQLAYFSILHSTYEFNTTFYSYAFLRMPENAFGYMEPDVVLNCIDYYDQNMGACDYFESWMKVIIASHLTSFSYIQYAENEDAYDYYEE